MSIPSTSTHRAARWLWSSCMVVLAVAVLHPGPAAAQDGSPAAEATPADSGFAVQPSGPDGPGSRDWFTYTLDPGAVFGDVVAISNLSDHPIRFAIFPTDAVSVADTAGFAALKDDETPVDVGTWIQLAAGEYTVEPGQRIDVPFSISVPEDAEPGDHAGAILAVDADEGGFDPATAPDGLSFNVRHRMGARVYVRVGGPVAPALRIDDLAVERDGGTATVHWEIANTGNLRLSPAVEVRITGLFGRTVRTVPAQEIPELLPGANYVGASIVSGLPSMEPLTAHVVAKAEGVETERSKQFAGYPWLLIAGLLAILLLAGWWYRRRRRQRRAGSGPPPSRSSDRVPVSA
jgi:LPXTG-motif cell wall-anchored protein